MINKIIEKMGDSLTGVFSSNDNNETIIADVPELTATTLLVFKYFFNFCSNLLIMLLSI